MKRKAMIFFLLVLFSATNVIYGESGENVERVNSDGEVWDASASYRGTKREIDYIQEAQQTLKYWNDANIKDTIVLKLIDKLTSFQESLLWAALDKFNYEPGEVYEVLFSCFETILGIHFHDVIIIYCEIQSDYSANWSGVLIRTAR